MSSDLQQRAASEDLEDITACNGNYCCPSDTTAMKLPRDYVLAGRSKVWLTVKPARRKEHRVSDLYRNSCQSANFVNHGGSEHGLLGEAVVDDLELAVVRPACSREHHTSGVGTLVMFRRER